MTALAGSLFPPLILAPLEKENSPHPPQLSELQVLFLSNLCLLHKPISFHGFMWLHGTADQYSIQRRAFHTAKALIQEEQRSVQHNKYNETSLGGFAIKKRGGGGEENH